MMIKAPPEQRRAATQAAAERNSRLGSRGRPALRILMAWVASRKRDSWLLTNLGRAGRTLIDEGFGPPSEAQLARDIETVLERARK